MSDLHERLTAAVTERLTYARPAQLISTTPELTAMIVAYCERDLRVLARHAPRQMTFGPEPRPSQCEACADMCHSGSGLGCDDLDAPYPCDDIRDLATAYGVDVDDA